MAGLVAGEKRAIKKKEVVKLADQLRKLIPSKEVIDQICGEVESGLHLSHFSERGRLWKHLCTAQSSRRVVLVQDASKAYLDILCECRSGRDKFARLQIRWMDLLRSVLYDETDLKDDSHCVQLRRLWCLIVAAADVREGYTEDSNALFCCIWRAVQNYWQKKVVDVKEGSVSSDHDDDDIELDAAEEAALAADETSLLRLGGFALHAAAKCMKQPELSVLWSLQMPASAKETLPTNLVHLDRGGMAFPKRELLGFLSEVRL